MQIKMNEVLSFQFFYTEVKNKSLPIKTAYKFTKLFNKVEEELKFYQEQIVKISEEYGERDSEGGLVLLESGNGIKIKPELIEECQLKITELLEIEVEIGEITFSIDELEGVEISIEDMNLLSKIITD